ncbi:MAG: metallophosphoesterase [Prolixibacteraceae bacterium]|nr:metallophosphoesterase [Prolixibacteraceae bacterium]
MNRKQMKVKSALQYSIIFLIMSLSQPTKSQIEFGVFADCQYCDCETWKDRFYRNSPAKLSECVDTFNQNKNIAFVVGLGDLIDRDFSSFDTLQPVLQRLNTRVYHVIGNHDLEVENIHYEKVPEKLQLSKTWYSFERAGWRFIFLDGNDITFHSNNTEVVKQAEQMTGKLKEKNKPNFHEWNGGIGCEQLAWLEEQLRQAQKQNQQVILFCHYPLLPLEAHTLWNSEEVLAILKKYDGVKCWMNGHNHSGNYVLWEGIHFLNLKGMVETQSSNAFAVVKLTSKSIEVKGYGNEPRRRLSLTK